MLFFVVLAVATTGAWIVGRGSASVRDHARWGLAIAMVVAGVFHLVQPDPFVQHLPDWVPAREPLVFLTGLVEIALGVALLGPRGRRHQAGRLLAAYLVAVFPANVYVAVAAIDVDGQPGGPYPWIRLPFQALFVAWALWSTQSDADVPMPAPTPGRGEPNRRPAVALSD
jgi:uncharacterized membrane protein